MWKALLSLYMADKDLPLPSIEEVLICSETTTTEEVTFANKFIMDIKFALCVGDTSLVQSCE